MRESDLRAREQEISDARGTAPPAGGRPHEQPAQAVAGALRVAVRRHRDAPQRRRRRERRRRHDEQRRHGAPDHRRHVGHRGRGRSRRDRHPARPDGTAGQSHDRRDPGQDLHGTRDRDRQQPDSGDRRADRRARTATNFKVVVTLDEQIPEVRPGFTCTAEITTATRAQGRGGADSGAHGARAALRREGQRRRAAAAPAQAAFQLRPPADAAGLGVDQHRAAAGSEARRDRRRVRGSRRQGAQFVPVKTRHRRRALLRGHRTASRKATASSPARSTRCAICTTAISCRSNTPPGQSAQPQR